MAVVTTTAAADPCEAASDGQARQEVAGPVSRVKSFRPSFDAPTLNLVTTSLAISATPEARIVCMPPVGDADRVRLAELSDRPAEAALCPVRTTLV